MNDRRRISLTSPPKEPVDVPTTPRPDEAWRAHRVRNTPDFGAWWFSHTDEGRFDLPAPDGTCYLASDAASALRERLGPTLAGLASVEAADIAGVGVSRLPIPPGDDLADTVAETAVNVPGLTREICTTVDYGLTRSWAVYFHVNQCGGVRYSARHTTALDSLSYALFGAAGTRATPPPVEVIAARSVAEAAGLRVVSESVPDDDIQLTWQYPGMPPMPQTGPNAPGKAEWPLPAFGEDD